MARHFAFLLSLFILFSFKLPAPNQRVIDYINTVLETQVGSGECWDFTVSAQYHAKSNNTAQIK